MNQTFTAIIQARMNSTRLPGKAMKKIGDYPMLFHVIKQTLSSQYIDDVVIATTTSSKDKQIVDFCKTNDIKYFRGLTCDVLDRYYNCAKSFSLDHIIRISSDCPFIDPKIIDRVIEKFLKKKYHYVGNNLEKLQNCWKNSICNFPQGMVVEISSFRTLEKAWKNAKKSSEREHVFPYVQFNPKIFQITNIKNKKNLSHIRCTVDEKSDLKFVREIWKRFPKSKKIIHMKDIENIVKKEPTLVLINNHINFDEGYQKSLQLDNKLRKRHYRK